VKVIITLACQHDPDLQGIAVSTGVDLKVTLSVSQQVFSRDREVVDMVEVENCRWVQRELTKRPWSLEVVAGIRDKHVSCLISNLSGISQSTPRIGHLRVSAKNGSLVEPLRNSAVGGHDLVSKPFPG